MRFLNGFLGSLGIIIGISYSIAQCPNDICENAINLVFENNVVCINQCNYDCTDEGQYTDCIGQDVDFWYSFTLELPSMLVMETTGTYEHPSLSVGDGFQIVILDQCYGSIVYCENVIGPPPQEFFDSTEILPEGDYIMQIDGLNPSLGCLDMCIAIVGLLGLDIEEIESLVQEGLNYESVIKVAYLHGYLNNIKIVKW